ncbi:MAG: hypothetical protein AABW86_06075 [Candidatus Micrarchaeota archaeon]
MVKTVQAKDDLRPAAVPVDAARPPLAERVMVTHNYSKVMKKLGRWVEQLNEALEGKREFTKATTDDLRLNFVSESRVITDERLCTIANFAIAELGKLKAPKSDAEAVSQMRDVTQKIMKEFQIGWAL